MAQLLPAFGPGLIEATSWGLPRSSRWRSYSRPSGRASLKLRLLCRFSPDTFALLPAFGPGLIEAGRRTRSSRRRSSLLPAFGPGLIEASSRRPSDTRPCSYSRPSGRASLKPRQAKPSLALPHQLLPAFGPGLIEACSGVMRNPQSCVRRAKALAPSGCEARPANCRSSRKPSERVMEVTTWTEALRRDGPPFGRLSEHAASVLDVKREAPEKGTSGGAAGRGRRW